MKKLSYLTIVTMLLFIVAGCSNEDSAHSHGEDGDHTHAEPAHSQAVGSEEMLKKDAVSPSSFAKSDTLSNTSRGVALTLYFDEVSGTLTGTLENTTEEALCGISVTASSENGTDFDTTEPTDLQAGQSTNVTIDASNITFTNWNAETTMKPCTDMHSHEDGSTHGNHN